MEVVVSLYVLIIVTVIINLKPPVDAKIKKLKEEGYTVFACSPHARGYIQTLP